MPRASNNSQARHRSLLPADVSPPPLTPLTGADPELAGLSLTRRNSINDRRIRDILIQLAGNPPDPNLQRSAEARPRGPPKLNVGKTNRLDAGRWYVQMSYIGGTSLYPQHITPRLDATLLDETEPLTRYLNMRDEINAALETNRIRKSRSISYRLQHQPQHATTATIADVQEAEPSASPVLTEHAAANGNVLDTSKPANLMIWRRDGEAPIQILGYPRPTSRLHLIDHRISLGVHHVEQGTYIEHFNQSHRGWVSIRWDSPLLVERAGACILLRIKGVTDLEHWDVHFGVAL